MMRLLHATMLTLLVCSAAFSQGPYRLVTIKDIQTVPMDSLKRADTLNYIATTRWTIQASPFAIAARETVEVVGQVIVPPGIFTTQVKGFNMVLKDTSEGNEFAYLFVRSAIDAAGQGGDSTGLKNDGFMSAERGDIIRLRGYVAEFPTNQMMSATQFTPVPGLTIASVTGTPVPPVIPKKVSDFFRGQAPASGSGPFPQVGVQLSTGEPYEGAYVQLTNLTVATTSGTTGATYVRMVDSAGNSISTYDLSRYWTLRTSTSTYPGFVPKDPNSTYNALPPSGARIDTIRGIITTVSSNQQYGYFIAPVFQGDLKFGITLPGIRTHRRTPVIVTTQDSVQITVQAFKQLLGNGIRSVKFIHQLNSAPWVADSINGPKLTDSLYAFKMGKLSAGDVLRYYFQAVDSAQNSSIYSNSGTGSTSDTTRGYFFYKVFGGPLTINDVQYTPYANGVSPYIAGVTSVIGVVTTDTSGLKAPLSTSNAGPWFVQSGTQPWNGLWINTAATSHLLDSLHVGDSVLVRGTVNELFDVTRLQNVDSLFIIKHGATLPQPVNVLTGSLGTRANGDPTAEQWESMVVSVNNVTITDVSPTGFADLTEMEIDDGSGRLILRMAEGKHQFSNVVGDVAIGKTILKVGDKFSYVRGILWYSFNKYKIVPRTDADFGTRTTGVTTLERQLPKEFALSQNYPNPFNPSTTIEFNIPASGFVSLKVYNVLGQVVKDLVAEYKTPGHYAAHFDASRLPSGLYIYRLQSGSANVSKRMLLIK